MAMATSVVYAEVAVRDVVRYLRVLARARSGNRLSALCDDVWRLLGSLVSPPCSAPCVSLRLPPTGPVSATLRVEAVCRGVGVDGAIPVPGFGQVHLSAAHHGAHSLRFATVLRRPVPVAGSPFVCNLPSVDGYEPELREVAVTNAAGDRVFWRVAGRGDSLVAGKRALRDGTLRPPLCPPDRAGVVLELAAPVATTATATGTGTGGTGPYPEDTELLGAYRGVVAAREGRLWVRLGAFAIDGSGGDAMWTGDAVRGDGGGGPAPPASCVRAAKRRRRW